MRQQPIDIIKTRVDTIAPQVLASLKRAARRVKDASVASSAGELSAVAKRAASGISGTRPKGQRRAKQRTKQLACDERCIDQKKGSMTNT